jgi:hypothetical protein
VIGNDASWEAVVYVCRGSLVQAQVGLGREMEAVLLHYIDTVDWNHSVGLYPAAGDAAEKEEFIGGERN